MNKSPYVFILLMCGLISCSQKHYGFREKISVGSKVAITTTKHSEIKLMQRQTVKTISSVTATIPSPQPIKVNYQKRFFSKGLKSGKIKVSQPTNTNLSENKENILEDSSWDWLGILLPFVWGIIVLGIVFLLWYFLFSTLFLLLGIILSLILGIALAIGMFFILWFIWTLIFGS